MALLDSLLTAIVRADGDALVMHVGERPYVVAPSGPVELSSRSLTLEAVSGMLGQLLPAEARSALDELGAIEHELPASDVASGERFTVVAARGGDDIWIEVRRHRQAPAVPEFDAAAFVEPPRLDAGAATLTVEDVATGATPVEPAADETIGPEGPAAGREEPPFSGEASPVEAAATPPSAAAGEAGEPGPAHEFEERRPALADVAAFEGEVESSADPSADETESSAPLAAAVPPPAEPPAPAAIADQMVPAFDALSRAADERTAGEPAGTPEAAESSADPITIDETTGPRAAMAVVTEPVPAADDRTGSSPAVEEDEMALFDTVTPSPAPSSAARRVSLPPSRPTGPPPRHLEVQPVEPGLPSRRAASGAAAEAFRPQPARPVPPVAEPPAAVVVSLPRVATRTEAPRAAGAARAPVAERLVRLAVSKGAQGLLLSSAAKPAIRIDGAVAFLDDEAPLEAEGIGAMLMALAPERHHDAVRAGASVEWVTNLADLGMVRVVAFRDHRGPGCVLGLVVAQTPTVEQLGLAREIQTLVLEGDGLVLVAGPRASGKSTLLAALVDLVNSRRGGYAVTIERQVRFAHESRAALVSQREVPHASHQGVAAWAALREDPDVLVIDDLRAAGAVEAAIDAVASGRLVVAAVMAHGAADGIDRLVSLVPPESRAETRLALSGVLRAVVSQVLLRKVGGGRVAARELLLNSPEVSDLVAGGRIDQLPAAQDAGRDAGMIPLADALLAFVQSGVVDAREAYRQASDRPGLLAALRREGLDTSFVERLA